MGARSDSFTVRCAWPKHFDAVPVLVALCCGIVIEALHGHACTGDGCVLCLAAALAQVLLVASIGVALVRPLVRVLAELRVDVLVRRDSRPLLRSSLRSGRVELTPVTLGVRLII